MADRLQRLADSCVFSLLADSLQHWCWLLCQMHTRSSLGRIKHGSQGSGLMDVEIYLLRRIPIVSSVYPL